MPSLCRESPGRLAVEAMANGIPVLASNRGALPHTLGCAGFAFTIPIQFTPTKPELPSPRDVAPWVAAIERHWDNPDLESRHQSLALDEAQRFNLEPVLDHYEDLFQTLTSRSITS